MKRSATATKKRSRRTAITRAAGRLSRPPSAPTPYDLSISKAVDNRQPLPQAVLTYTIIVTNRGPGDASGVVVTDLLPPALAFVGIVPLSSGSAVHNAATNQVVWSIGNLAVGESRRLSYRVRINSGVSDQEIIVNLARVDGDEPETDYTNNTDRAIVRITRTTSNLLPFTGRSVAMGIWVALAMILAGLISIETGRRRRR